MRSAVARATRVLADTAGLSVDAQMRKRLERLLGRLAAEAGTDPATWVDGLDARPADLQLLLDRMTVQETSFFRDPTQLSGFTSQVLPLLPDPVTVWSAGCSDGREPYTLAMCLLEAGRAEARVLATDVSTPAVARTERGLYHERELRGLSPERRARWLRPHPEGWEVAPELRALVTPRRHNLVSDPPPAAPGICSAVFCRNVLIYFTEADLRSVLGRFHRLLHPDGWLLLGFSESLWQVDSTFAVHPIGGGYAYRPVGATTAPAAASMPELDVPATTAPATDPVQELLAALREGEAQLAEGCPDGAVRAFRLAVSLAPDNPVTHLQLSYALEADGDRVAAQRAVTVAREALHRGGKDAESLLEGFTPATLVPLVENRLEELT